MGGSTSTHVANSFSEPIYVMVDAERRRLSEGRLKVEEFFSIFETASESGALDADMRLRTNIIHAGFSLIQPRNYLRFDVDCTGTSTAYISVFYMRAGRPVWIACALPRKEDRSVIITEEPQLVDAEYGSVWKRAN